MTKEECIKRSEEFKDVSYLGGKFIVSPIGEIWAAKVEKNNDSFEYGNFEKRNYFFNSDGYVCISAPVIINGRRSWYSIGVHILVAKAWVPNPDNKPEVNHLDFDRSNYWAYNLEWVTHQENIAYSHKAGRYKGRFGEANPNYENNTLHLKYLNNPDYAIKKQSRPGGKNGKAKKCNLFHEKEGFIGTFEYQRDAVNCLIGRGIVKKTANKESVIHYLRREQGYKGYFLRLI